MLNYLRCFPKVFCVQIVGYAGQPLFNLPLSTRIIILRDYERNIDFTGNVAMIQTKNIFKVSSAFFTKFREKGVVDVSQCDLRDLFMLGIEKTKVGGEQFISSIEETYDIPQLLTEEERAE